MDLSKKTNLAKARKNVQEKKAREERDLRHATKEQFEAFIGDLGAVLAQGVRVEGLGDVDSIVCRIEAYGQDIADLVGRIVECTAAIPNLDELRLPDTIELKTVTDPKLLDALEKVGDDGLLLEKFQALDETLILLSDAISKDQSPGQTEEDFQPVRIVLGREGSLKFLEQWPTPVFSSGGGSGGTSGGLTDAQLRASPVPVLATIDTTGLATSTGQTEIVDAIEAIPEGLTDVQLRATPVPVSGTISTGLSQPLTDAQLRATPVPVSGTVATGGLTDAQLRATPVDVDTGLTQPTTPSDTQPVSAASLPLPSGAATAANQQTDALTDTELRASPLDVDTGLTQPLTDTQLRATPVPVSGTITATISGVSTAAKQDTGNASLASIDGKIVAVNTGAVVVASGSITANAGTNLNTSALAVESGGNLAAIKAKTDNIPPLGQALAAASTPVVLTAAQLTTLTPPAAITGYATETTLGTRLSESDFDTKTGSLTETAPASDTASSGLNGRLQRVAQRLTSLLAELQLKADLTETQPVSLASVPSHAVTNAGTFAVQNTAALPAGTNAIGKLAANSGVDIGDVDVTSLPVAFNAGTTSATTQRTIKATGSTSTQTQVADSASSQTILAANTGRIRATIVNDSTTTLYLRESSSAATTSVYTYKMYPDETVIIDDYNGALTGIWSANASGNAIISEVTA